jgi:hypothetical protein
MAGFAWVRDLVLEPSDMTARAAAAYQPTHGR